MLVYQIYKTFNTREKVMDFCKWQIGPWKDLNVFFGFYKEQGGHAECVKDDRYGPREFRYSSEKDVLIKVSVERNIVCVEAGLDLLCWINVPTGKAYWSLCDYMGFAVPIGTNLYKIPT